MKWITDRPPKEYESVLITHDVGKNSPILKVDSAWVCHIEDDTIDFLDTGYGEMWYGRWGKEVKAWKPLPEPFDE